VRAHSITLASASSDQHASGYDQLETDHDSTGASDVLAARCSRSSRAAFCYNGEREMSKRLRQAAEKTVRTAMQSSPDAERKAAVLLTHPAGSSAADAQLAARIQRNEDLIAAVMRHSYAGRGNQAIGGL
jgi:hypothetical protein